MQTTLERTRSQTIVTKTELSLMERREPFRHLMTLVMRMPFPGFRWVFIGVWIVMKDCALVNWPLSEYWNFPGDNQIL